MALFELSLVVLSTHFVLGPGQGLDLPVTWLSAGDGPGQALMLATPQSEILPHPTLSARLIDGDSELALAVLQQGNGTVTLGLPEDFRLARWDIQLCADSLCTEPISVYEPDVWWTSCDGVACSPGAPLRVFGRRLAFDDTGCRAINSTEPAAGRELQLQLTPRTGEVVVLTSERLSCYEAIFTLPHHLPLANYSVAVANSVASRRGRFVLPEQLDVQHLQIVPPATRGTEVFVVQNKTGAGIISALAAAAANAGGGVVQLEAGRYTMKDSDTLVVGDGVTLRGAGALETTLEWGLQTLTTSAARGHLALIHGDNTTGGWTLEDLSIIAPQADHQNQYDGSAVVSDCGDGSAGAPPQDENGLWEYSWACSGMIVSRVHITIDKECAFGTAWPEERNWGKSCGGYTDINASTPGDMLAGVPFAVRIFGENAIFQDSQITHYGTCGSNVAFAIEIKDAKNVVVRRNTLLYGCAAFSFASTTVAAFEHNKLVPYKNASGGGSNIQDFGARHEMRRLIYANNSQHICPDPNAYCPQTHLETVTTDGGAGFYEGSASVSEDGITLTTSKDGTYCPDEFWCGLGKHRPSWRFASVSLLSGPGAGQWRRAELQGATNTTWRLDRPFEVGHGPVSALSVDRPTFVVVSKLMAHMLFLGNQWSESHFQFYAQCLDCVVAENTFRNSFAASWGRNPHWLAGGWQPNMQVEWLKNNVFSGSGISLMTSDQPLTATGEIKTSFAGSLNSRVVLRGNVFWKGTGVQLGLASTLGFAQTNGNILIDSNVLDGNACNLTIRPMPAGADINGYLPCGRNCSLHDIILHANKLVSVRSCGHNLQGIALKNALNPASDYTGTINTETEMPMYQAGGVHATELETNDMDMRVAQGQLIV